ncbi:MAG: hypothetical protein ACKON7_01935, partial [Planctomycetaceae bacterium]
LRGTHRHRVGRGAERQADRAGLDADGGLAEFARALDMCREGTALVSWTIECPWGAEIRVSRRTGPAVRSAQAARLLEAA